VATWAAFRALVDGLGHPRQGLWPQLARETLGEAELRSLSGEVNEAGAA